MKLKFLVIILLSTSYYSYGQSSAIKNLVFEGAGIRGIAYAGVVNEFENAGLLDSLEKVGGTSAGGIIALTLALGYSGKEISEIVGQTEFEKFNNGRFFFIGGTYRMHKKYGWYRGEKFYDWIENIIGIKTGNPDITFQQLYNLGYKGLYLTAVCLNKQEVLTFSRETYPDMKIKDAVRITMSVPLYFEAVFIDSRGEVVEKPGKRKDLDIVIDGGVLANFPITMFDSVITEGNKKTRFINSGTIGVRIDIDEQIKRDSIDQHLAAYEINNLKDYIQAFYILILENLNRTTLTEDDWKRTISISSAGIGPKVKKLSEKQKNMLIESGRKSALLYISKCN